MSPTDISSKQIRLYVGCVTFNTRDLGRHLVVRRIWKQHCRNVDCFIFMVDSSDHYRLTEARHEVSRIFSESNRPPVIVIGNKIDLPDSCNYKLLHQYLGLEYNQTNVCVFMCSIVACAGIKDVFKWFVIKI